MALKYAEMMEVARVLRASAVGLSHAGHDYGAVVELMLRALDSAQPAMSPANLDFFGGYLKRSPYPKSLLDTESQGHPVAAIPAYPQKP